MTRTETAYYMRRELGLIASDGSTELDRGILFCDMMAKSELDMLRDLGENCGLVLRSLRNAGAVMPELDTWIQNTATGFMRAMGGLH